MQQPSSSEQLQGTLVRNGSITPSFMTFRYVIKWPDGTILNLNLVEPTWCINFQPDFSLFSCLKRFKKTVHQFQLTSWLLNLKKTLLSSKKRENGRFLCIWNHKFYEMLTHLCYEILLVLLKMKITVNFLFFLDLHDNIYLSFPAPVRFKMLMSE